MTAWQALILGLVEGLTEFLPVSSTGHLILASNIMGIENNAFLKVFEIVIQAGAIAAVIWIFWQEIIGDRGLWKKLLVAFIPTAFLGLLFHGLIKKYLFQPEVVCGALVIGGIALIVLEFVSARLPDRALRLKHYSLIGLAQCLAFVPGVSRSAATILGARLLGASRELAVKFSFLLAIPTILSASGYSLLKMNYALTNHEIAMTVIGLVSSFVFGFLSIKFFLRLLNQRTFLICGVYRIVLGIIYFMLIAR